AGGEGVSDLAVGGEEGLLGGGVAGEGDDGVLGVDVGDGQDGAGDAGGAGHEEDHPRPDVQGLVEHLELGQEALGLAAGVLHPLDREVGEDLDRDAGRGGLGEVVGQRRQVAGGLGGGGVGGGGGGGSGRAG